RAGRGRPLRARAPSRAGSRRDRERTPRAGRARTARLRPSEARRARRRAAGSRAQTAPAPERAAWRSAARFPPPGRGVGGRPSRPVPRSLRARARRRSSGACQSVIEPAPARPARFGKWYTLAVALAITRDVPASFANALASGPTTIDVATARAQ